MDKFLLQELRARRPSIRREWMTLLRVEPVSTPLGHPDTLSHLIDRTLDEVFADLGRRKLHRTDGSSHSYDEVRHACACGRNPLLAYFLAGERALLEALVQAQAARPDQSGEHRHNNLTELYLVIRGTAQREVSSFCALCQHKPGLAAEAPKPSA